MMRKFLENWNYKKHATAVTGIYLGVAVIGNALLGKTIPRDEKTMNPLTTAKQMTKKQWILDGILLGCYSLDMSLTYCILNHFKKQYK